ncbi:hypothetical protein J6590_062661 [Homalodisca vitripennis]|nr:hypothetical protein J6590_062661 [Homalodisca vitripennis]
MASQLGCWRGQDRSEVIDPKIDSAYRLWNALSVNVRAIDKRARFGAEVRALMLGAQGKNENTDRYYYCFRRNHRPPKLEHCNGKVGGPQSSVFLGSVIPGRKWRIGENYRPISLLDHAVSI